MIKKKKSIFPCILVSIMIHAIVFFLLFTQGKKEKLDLIEVSFDTPTKIEEMPIEEIEQPPEPEPEPEPKPEPEPPLEKEEPKPEPKLEPKPEPKLKDTKLKEKEKKTVSDENSKIKVKEEEEGEGVDSEEAIKQDAKEITKFPKYAVGILKKIESNIKRRREDDKLYAEIFFRINRDGSISGLRIKKSSGNARYDEEGIEAIKKSAPFERLPEDFPSDKLRLVYRHFKRK